MNRDFVYNNEDRPTAWSRAGSTLNKWLWGALCCGVPGIPCYFCTCCEKMDDTADRDRPRVNQATATAERTLRQHRPHAPRGRKSTPEMLSAVRCALSQLQGEPAPLPPAASRSAPNSPEPVFPNSGRTRARSARSLAVCTQLVRTIIKPLKYRSG